MIVSHTNQKNENNSNKSDLEKKFKIVSNGKKPINENIIKFALSPEISEKFEKFCLCVNKNPYENPEYSYNIMENKLRSILPQELIQALREMSKTGKPGMLLIDGFPVDSSIPPRSDYEDPLDRRDAKPTKISEFAMLAVTSIMGKHLHSNPKEHNGAIIHQISPIRTKYLTASSQGAEPLIYHVENAVEKQTPDFLILICLEGDPQAATAYFFVGDFIKNLPENIIKSMKKDNFTIRSGASYDEVEINRLPLLSEDNNTGKLQVRLHEILCDRFQPLTEEASDTINFLKEKLANVRNNDSYVTGNVSLKKGQVLILNNAWGIGQVDGIMHARDGRITNDGRWLQRGFMYPNTEEDNKKMIEGHTQALYDTLSSKGIPVSESSSQLREVMLSTDSALEYLKNNRNATKAQIALYGTKPQRFSKMISEAHNNRSLDSIHHTV